MNPYAPPKAVVEAARESGALWREGALVAMERAGALPDRCIACNAPATGYRLARTLYWSPWAWRIGAFAAPFVATSAGIALEIPVLAMSFLPLVLILLIANALLRKTFKVELGVCPRHRRLHRGLQLASLAALAGVIGAFFLLGEAYDAALALLWISLGATVVLGIVQTRVGVQRVGLRRLDAAHAWLGGAGPAFRASLPERPG